MDPQIMKLLGGSEDFQNFLLIKDQQTKIIDKYSKGKLTLQQANKYVEKITQWTKVLDRRYNNDSYKD